MTNGDVRDNWIKYGEGHVVARDAELARLAASKRRLSAELRLVNKRLRALAQE